MLAQPMKKSGGDERLAKWAAYIYGLVCASPSLQLCEDEAEEALIEQFGLEVYQVGHGDHGIVSTLVEAHGESFGMRLTNLSNQSEFTESAVRVLVLSDSDVLRGGWAKVRDSADSGYKDMLNVNVSNRSSVSTNGTANIVTWTNLEDALGSIFRGAKLICSPAAAQEGLLARIRESDAKLGSLQERASATSEDQYHRVRCLLAQRKRDLLQTIYDSAHHLRDAENGLAAVEEELASIEKLATVEEQWKSSRTQLSNRLNSLGIQFDVGNHPTSQVFGLNTTGFANFGTTSTSPAPENHLAFHGQRHVGPRGDSPPLYPREMDSSSSDVANTNTNTRMPWRASTSTSSDGSTTPSPWSTSSLSSDASKLMPAFNLDVGDGHFSKTGFTAQFDTSFSAPSSATDTVINRDHGLASKGQTNADRLAEYDPSSTEVVFQRSVPDKEAASTGGVYSHTNGSGPSTTMILAASKKKRKNKKKKAGKTKAPSNVATESGAQASEEEKQDETDEAKRERWKQTLAQLAPVQDSSRVIPASTQAPDSGSEISDESASIVSHRKSSMKSKQKHDLKLLEQVLAEEALADKENAKQRLSKRDASASSADSTLSNVRRPLKKNNDSNIRASKSEFVQAINKTQSSNRSNMGTASLDSQDENSTGDKNDALLQGNAISRSAFEHPESNDYVRPDKIVVRTKKSVEECLQSGGWTMKRSNGGTTVYERLAILRTDPDGPPVRQIFSATNRGGNVKLLNKLNAQVLTPVTTGAHVKGGQRIAKLWCTTCKASHPEYEFSTSQIKLGGERRCNTCVSNNVFP